MRTLLAKLLRKMFYFNFINKKHYYGLMQKVFKPLKLFKGVKCKVNYIGFSLTLSLDDWIQEYLYFLGNYEAAELKVMERHLKKDSIFFDIGANMGLYTLHASRIISKEGAIISFEPYSVNFKNLSENIANNNITNVHIENMAVGKENGTLSLYYDEKEKNLGMVTANYLENGKTEDVKMISIDSYVEMNVVTKVDFIKIDIEGFEYQALLGMEKTLKAFKPNLLIEILENNTNDNTTTFLENIGYKKHYIDDFGNISLENTNRKNYLFKAEC